MQNRSLSLVIIALLAATLLVAACGSSLRSDSANARDSQQWEFLRAQVTNLEGCELELNGVEQMIDPNKSRYDCMNDLGAQGWELVAVSDTSYYFKRPR